MKKTYEKPGLESRTFAQFENVFTACTKGNAHAQGCTYCGPWNPGVDVHEGCPICGKVQDDHAAFSNGGGGGS